MIASRTHRGRVPARLSTCDANALAIPYLDRAAAKENPPSNIIIVPLNMEANTALAAALAVISAPVESRMIPMGTIINGIRQDVA
ncbi:hypothetical protein G6F68_020499 [Rhizopus microsporus]|nr:hypothetical protein G6F68_020499 [Rhizopus microsporus]